MESNSILVLGLGELGSSVTRHLAARTRDGGGPPVSVLLREATIHGRDPAKRRSLDALRALGVELVSGDVTAPSADLAATFAEFDTVVCCTGFVGGLGTQLAITGAALDAGIRRYVPWQFGVDYDVVGRGSGQDVWDEQLDVRDLLRSQSRTQWSIISTGMFTSFLFDPAFGVVDLDRNVVHALGSWANEVTVTAPDDIGRVTADVLLAEPPVTDGIIYTAGDTISYGRLADTVDHVLDRTLDRVEWTLPWLRDQLAEQPDDLIKKYRVAFAKGTGVSWPVEGTYNARNGIDVADVERWLRAR